MVTEYRWIDLSLIDLPAQVRRHSPEKVAELAQDMSRNGQLQDIIITPKSDGRYEIVAGNSRRMAAIELKWVQIRCLVKDNLSEFDRARITIAENDEREDLTAVDRGLSYIWAMKAGNMTQEALAAAIGKTHSHISQYVSAAGILEPVRSFVNRFAMGIAHINQLVRLPTPASQLSMADRCQKEDLSVRQLEHLINRVLAVSSQPAPASIADKQTRGGAAADKQSCFIIEISAHGIHIEGDFPETVTLPELTRALEESLRKWRK